jgi:fibronectin type 3 domain-containing protein
LEDIRLAAELVRRFTRNATSYDDYQIKGGTTYYYIVKSVDQNGVESPASGERTSYDMDQDKESLLFAEHWSGETI